ncbi:tyrosine-type recombinase/integrase [Thiomonas sp.]
MPSISRTFDLKADAENWARDMEREAQRGNMSALRDDAGRTTLEQVATQYVAGPVQLLASRADVTRYMQSARARFGPLFLSSIRGVDVAAWRDELLRDGLSPQSVIHHLNALSGLFSFVEKELSIDLPAGNPVAKVRKPATPKSRDRRLLPGELDALMNAASAPGLRQIIILAIESSMRLGELLELEWKRVDLSRRTAHLTDTKNGESRTVALSSEAIAALQALPRRIDGRVFHWAAPDSFNKTWSRLVERSQTSYLADCIAQGTKPDPAFLADLRFHDLRHEATSRLFEKGLGVMEVASMTGHKSLAMLKRYTHIEAAKLAQKLG